MTLPRNTTLWLERLRLCCLDWYGMISVGGPLVAPQKVCPCPNPQNVTLSEKRAFVGIIKDLWGQLRVSGWALNSQTNSNVLIKRQKRRHRHGEKRSVEGHVKIGVMQPQSRNVRSYQKWGEARNRLSPSASGGGTTLSPFLFWTSVSQNCRKFFSVVLITQLVVICSSSPRKLI